MTSVRNKTALVATIIPKNSKTWLLQPISATWMKNEYNLMQQKIFMQIISRLQSAIQEAITNKKNNNIQTLSIFTHSEYADGNDPTVIVFKIPINQFGIPRNSYNELKTALKAISTMPVEIPYKDDKGRNWVIFNSLCACAFPLDKRVNEVHFRMNRHIAEKLLSLDFGYHKCLLETTILAKNLYTPKIYNLLSIYKDKGGVKLEIEKLRNYLLTEKKYPRFRDFKKRILEPVQLELKKQATEGTTDLYFEYELYYNPERTRKAGEPDKIIFKIIPAEIYLEEEKSLEQKKKYIFDLCQSQYILMDSEQANAIMLKINSLNYFSVAAKLIELQQYFASPTCNIDRKSSYAFSTINNLLSENDNNIEY